MKRHFENKKKGREGRGVKGQRGKGAEGRRGRGAEGQFPPAAGVTPGWKLPLQIPWGGKYPLAPHLPWALVMYEV